MNNLDDKILVQHKRDFKFKVNPEYFEIKTLHYWTKCQAPRVSFVRKLIKGKINYIFC